MGFTSFLYYVNGFSLRDGSRLGNAITTLKMEFPDIRIEKVGYTYFIIAQKQTLAVNHGSYSGNGLRYNDHTMYNPNYKISNDPTFKDLQVYVKDPKDIEIDETLRKRLDELDLGSGFGKVGTKYIHYVFGFTE